MFGGSSQLAGIPLRSRIQEVPATEFGRVRTTVAVAALAAMLALVGMIGPVRSAVPGTNGLIAFTSDVNGGGAQLYTMDSGGGSITQLTAFGNPIESPAWSPDGDRIAFSQAGILYTIDPATQIVTPVIDPNSSGLADYEPTWSPDGTMLAFSRRAGTDSGIWRVNVDGTNLIRLSDRDDRDPAWSPDGGSIAFTRWALPFGEVGSSPGTDIYVMNTGGTGQIRLTGRNNAADPTWSPDGGEIAYVARQPEPDIYVVNPTDFNSVLRQVTFDLALEFGPSWSPDGTKIVFERGRADGTANNIFTANADGSGHEAQLTSFNGDRSPDWQSLSAPATQATCSIGSVLVEEGDSGTADATFEIDCENPDAVTYTVDYATADGTAHSSGDYTAGSGTFSVLPGSSHLQVDIPVAGDVAPEPHETFTFNLTSADVTFPRPTATATITDDDGFTIHVETLSVTEGDAGFQDIDLAATLSDAADQPVRADLVIRSVAALFGADYDLLSSATVAFDPGDVREPVTFRIYGDADVEGDQKIEITPVAQLVTDANSVEGGIWIRDDDVASLPTLAIGDVTVAEGNAGTIEAVLTVTLSAASTLPVTVDYATAASSATAPADFAADADTLVFDPGGTAEEVRIDVVGDTLDEVNETFAVDLSNPTNATIADTFAIVTITDDDAPPTLCVNDNSAIEGDTGTTPLVFTICLSAPSGKVVTVSYATANGTAVSSSDYTATSGTLTLPVGATTAQVSVNVRGDVVDEANETFTLNLSGESDATIADGTGAGTIVDDDPKPVIASFQPGNAPQGETVAIRGSGFTGATQVAFARAGGGTVNATTFRVVNDGRVTATVPPLATTGRVSITTAAGTGTSPINLLIEPRIASFSPTAGPPGTVVTISGMGFTGATAVRFGSTVATTFAVATDTQIVATVPAGATTGKVTVATPGGSDTSMGKFTVQ